MPNLNRAFRRHGSSFIVHRSIDHGSHVDHVVPEVSPCDSSLERKHFLARRVSSNDSESSKWGIIVDSRGLARRWAEILISDFQALDPTSGLYWIASSIWATLDANRSPESGRPKSESCSPPERDVIAYEKRSTNVMHVPIISIIPLIRSLTFTNIMLHSYALFHPQVEANNCLAF